jgi:uncharacterized protein (UPF0548 family)
MDLRAAQALQPHRSYLGATEAAALAGAGLPTAFHRLRLERRVGQGPAAFAAAAECVLSWQMHRDAGMRVAASEPRAVPGATIVCSIGVGPLRLSAPCRVSWAVDEPTRRGFGYATLPGHPESGEEAFVARLDEQGRVWLSVVAFSRPGRWFTAVSGPVIPLLQRAVVRRYVRAVRRAVARAA